MSLCTYCNISFAINAQLILIVRAKNIIGDFEEFPGWAKTFLTLKLSFTPIPFNFPLIFCIKMLGYEKNNE
jgi:hypothetical protein